MSEPFIAEIRMWGLNFAPRGWALCNGQLLPVSQNTALFSLVGTTYGGDGRTTFGLPDLQGKAPMHAGGGPGLSSRRLGESGGSESVSLNSTQMPSHSHSLLAYNDLAELQAPGPTRALARSQNGNAFNQVAGGTQSDMSANALEASPGSNGSHNNMMPYQVILFCIALQGIYPSRS
jgi:microcystin-dependent protein